MARTVAEWAIVGMFIDITGETAALRSMVHGTFGRLEEAKRQRLALASMHPKWTFVVRQMFPPLEE